MAAIYEGPDTGHGTHVSGIIAADANNTFGIQGIAKSAKIMLEPFQMGMRGIKILPTL